MSEQTDQKYDEQQFTVGKPVVKTGGDYTYKGIVVAAFRKTSGQWRYVVENADGVLHIFSAKQLAIHED